MPRSRNCSTERLIQIRKTASRTASKAIDGISGLRVLILLTIDILCDGVHPFTKSVHEKVSDYTGSPMVSRVRIANGAGDPYRLTLAIHQGSVVQARGNQAQLLQSSQG